MKYAPLLPDGPDVESIAIDEDGVVTTTYNDGTQTTTNAVQAISDRQRGRAVATHGFFKRKRRLWPTPRI